MSTTVRTFRAADVRTALAQVKSALGKDAVILSTREVGGSMFRRPEVEITAGLVEPSPEPAPAAQAARAHATYLSAPTSSKAAPLPKDAEVLHLRRALDEARGELALLRTAAESSSLRGADPALELVEQLRTLGVEEALAKEAVERARASSAPLAEGVRAAFADLLVAGRAPWLKDRKRIIALVGPTGVGKTTTLAKIAARALMDSALKVALVTLDTYRVGACEQVARYADIMKVPSFVARDAVELTRALERCNQAELVLVDTAGRSLSEAVARQAEWIRTVPGAELYLVAAANASHQDLAKVAERYRPLGPERVILTKLDEAAAPGGVLSLLRRVGRPVACVADGQRVPEDLHPASTSALLSRLLKDGPPMRAQAGGAL